jgi:large subunit ribosomal protein L17
MTAPQRKAMLRSLTLALIEQETIRTTPARAKELRWYADRVVTLAKRGDLHSRRQIVSLLGSCQTNARGENRIRKVLDRLYTNIAPRFKERAGGYTQLIRLAVRRAGDNAEMCVFRYLPSAENEKPAKSDKGKKTAASKEARAESVNDKPAKTKTAKAKSKPAKLDQE